LRLLHNSRSPSAGFRHGLAGVSERLVSDAVLIRARCLHVAVGIQDLGRRIRFLHLHPGHHNAGAIGREDCLHQFAHLLLDRLAVRGQDRFDPALADHFAHGALRNRLDRRIRLEGGILHVEQEGWSIIDPPIDRKMMSTMFSSPVKERLSSGTLVETPEGARR
jgi:hypothetical protein